MDIPSLPSDNLYKFVALSGILITLFSLTYPLSKTEEYKFSVIDAQTEQAKLNIEFAEIEHAVESLEKAKQSSQQDVTALRERLIQRQN
jgi:predicted  nucleic acid-binding Zn-ribbon protein